MPNTLEVDDRAEFQTLKQSVKDEAEEASRKGEVGEANRNLHRVEMIRNPHGEPDFGEEQAVIMQFDQAYRPGGSHGELGRVKMYYEEDIDDMDENLFEDRLERSSSPYVDKRKLSPADKRPEENVQAAHDYWSVDRALEEELGVDLDLLGNDMDRTRNVPKMDLSNKSQEGIDVVKEHKGNLITDRAELEKHAAQILRQFPDYNATGQPALHTKDPIELANFVEEELEEYFESHKVNDTRANQLWNNIQELREGARHLLDLSAETADIGREEFRHTLKEPGFTRPSGLGAEDAVDDYGIGGKGYLGLLD